MKRPVGSAEPLAFVSPSFELGQRPRHHSRLGTKRRKEDFWGRMKRVHAN